MIRITLTPQEAEAVRALARSEYMTTLEMLLAKIRESFTIESVTPQTVESAKQVRELLNDIIKTLGNYRNPQETEGLDGDYE